MKFWNTDNEIGAFVITARGGGSITINFNTKYACADVAAGGSSGLSGGWIFMIM